MCPWSIHYLLVSCGIYWEIATKSNLISMELFLWCGKLCCYVIIGKAWRVSTEYIEAQQFQALSNNYHQHWNTLRCDGSQSRELLYLVLLSVSLMKWWKAQNFVLQKFIVVTPWHLGMCWWIIRIDWGIL